MVAAYSAYPQQLGFWKRSRKTIGLFFDTAADDYFPQNDYFPDIKNIFGDMAASDSTPTRTIHLPLHRAYVSASYVHDRAIINATSTRFSYVDFILLLIRILV